MRAYEAVIIYRPEAEVQAAGREFVKSLFSGNGCKILKEEEMGDRPLAYEVKKAKRGVYVIYTLEVDPQNIPALDRAVKLRSEILKHLFVRKGE